jgi:hypothetical protein
MSYSSGTGGGYNNNLKVWKERPSLSDPEIPIRSGVGVVSRLWSVVLKGDHRPSGGKGTEIETRASFSESMNIRLGNEQRPT